MSTIFSTEIKQIGAKADQSKGKKLMVLFGSSTPDELKDYCYNISGGAIESDIKVGQKVIIAGNEYKITAVGEEAQKTLKSIGHCVFKFTGKTQSDLPGAIHLEDKVFPEVSVGDKIEIVD